MIMMRFFLVLTLFTLTACNDNDPHTPRPTTPQASIQINANSYTDWVYFSFDSGRVVTPADPATSLEWDIAFHMWDVRTNSGASGPGQGGAQRTYRLPEALSDKTIEPDAALFVRDATIRTFISTPSMRPGASIEAQKVATSGNTALAEWIDVDLSVMPPRITWQESDWWVRTADGDYVLLRITDYLNDTGDPFTFYPTFDYWLR